MEQSYLICNCGVASCNLGWKINSCTSSDKWNLFQHGELHSKEYDLSCNTRVIGRKPQQRKGIALCVQKIFNARLKVKSRLTAFDLRSKLIDRRFKNKNKPIEKQSEKYNFREQLIPTLKQT
jgi:hypothetical protein